MARLAPGSFLPPISSKEKTTYLIYKVHSRTDPTVHSTVHSMADLANFTVSDFCRRTAPDDQPKFDIADYIAQQHVPIF
jgi:hypothetical protein